MKNLTLVIDFIVKFIAVFGISSGVVIASVNVIGRYVFNFSFTWAAELTVYAFLWSMFFTSAFLFKLNAHISISLLVQALPKKYSKLVFITTQSISAIFLTVVSYYGYQYILLMIELEEMSVDLEIPTWIPYSVVPITFIISIYYILSNIVTTIKTPSEELQYKHDEKDMLQEGQQLLKTIEKKTGGLV